MGLLDGRALMLDVVPIAPRCACFILLGAARSQQQPARPCWRCGAYEGTGDQPHTY